MSVTWHFLSELVCYNEKGAALWNETVEGFFPGFNSRDQTLMIPRAFSSVLEKYECKFQEERTATLESLFSKQLELFMFSEMSSGGQRMVLIMPRLQVWSPSGPFSEELELMIHVVPSISKYSLSLWLCLTFVSLSHENQISIKYWPEAQNVSASTLKKGLIYSQRSNYFSQNNLSIFYFNPLGFLPLKLTELYLDKDRSGKLLIQVSTLWSFRW